MEVIDIIRACEYRWCEVLDACGNVLEVTEDVYHRTVSEITARDGIVQIWTFINFDKIEWEGGTGND